MIGRTQSDDLKPTRLSGVQLAESASVTRNERLSLDARSLRRQASPVALRPRGQGAHGPPDAASPGFLERGDDLPLV